ncbi:GxxExxY protein [Longimicrobium sp.]|jgi:iron complex transport system substrate-binding protein|uniref:GxxExxY protein n=1 Tax=Longimicrobium sp. TaxID=2029185 RepID=UPI002F934988
MRDVDEVSGAIVDAALRLHTRLGPGLLESVYEVLLARMLEKRGLSVERQLPVTFEMDGIRFEEGFRVDLLVDKRIVVELKSVEKLADVHPKQLLTYLRLLDLRVGLLINFGAARMKDGIHRIVNGHTPSTASPLRLHKSPMQFSATSAPPRDT